MADFKAGNYAVYDAMENRAYRATSENGDIFIEVPPYGSIIILTGDIEYDKLDYKKDSELIKEIKFDSSYKLSLSKENGPYEYVKTMSELYNITGPKGDARFSGNMKYETVLNVSEKGRYVIDLGKVGEAVKLNVNGKYSGARISPPYLFDITDFIKAGENALEIIVSNHLAYTRRDLYSNFHLYEASALLGPVKIKLYNK
jgi:hypothetical protein